ncbi:MAG: GxxExxY protein [Methanocorpusculum parvum]|nr:GxxExxY protein [Methanocorpusculum parvum]
MSDGENIVLYREESHEIMECAFSVYNNLGPGFLEAVYQEALELELHERSIPFISQEEITLYYKGKELSKKYIADIVVDNKIILELKSTTKLTSADYAQLINYLKATGIQLGILLNFGHKKRLEWERRVYTNTRYLEKNLPKNREIL